MSEAVMVVPTSELTPFFRGRTFDLIRDETDAMLALVAARHTFVPRDEAEVSPQYRQIIPYVLITHGDDWFVLRRTTKQTEVRLHHKVSLGIGGHINPGHDLRAGLQKELDEEVQIDDPYELEFVGILNDETTEVGRVHLGAVYVLRASSARVRVLETEKMIGEWTARVALAGLRDSMETWSQVVCDTVII